MNVAPLPIVFSIPVFNALPARPAEPSPAASGTGEGWDGIGDSIVVVGGEVATSRSRSIAFLSSSIRASTSVRLIALA